ncbi:MAG: glycosyltransferase family 4 protein [Cytophagaceae bacterium]
MKILYIHQYYKTPEEGGAIRSYNISKALVKAGHDVELITSHNEKFYNVKTIEGVKIHYLPVYYDNKLGNFDRIVAFFKFAGKAVRLVNRHFYPDICYVTSTPLTVGIIALFLKFWKKVPFIFEVRDLWPKVPIEMQAIHDPFMKSLALRLEKRLYNKAEAIVALSPAAANEIKMKAPGKSVYCIPNFSDTEFFQPAAANISKQNYHEAEGKFVITYFGAAGRANGLHFLINAAAASSHNKLPVQFYIAAQGSELDKIKRRVEMENLTNVKFLPYMNKKELKGLLDISDASYISFLDIKALETGSPNKFFDSLAAGKITIVNFGGWIAELVESRKTGFYYSPYNTKEFVEKLKMLIEDKVLAAQFKINSRKLAEEKFSEEKMTQEVIKVIEGMK